MITIQPNTLEFKKKEKRNRCYCIFSGNRLADLKASNFLILWDTVNQENFARLARASLSQKFITANQLFFVYLL